MNNTSITWLSWLLGIIHSRTSTHGLNFIYSQGKVTHILKDKVEILIDPFTIDTKLMMSSCKPFYGSSVTWRGFYRRGCRFTVTTYNKNSD